MRIAIVKLSALGDIVHAMVVLQFIKKFNQEISIDWFVEDQFKYLLEDHPHINKVHLVNLKKAKKKKSLSHLFKELRRLKSFGHYDLVIDLQGILKSAIISKLISSDNTVGFDRMSARESLSSFFYNRVFNLSYDKNVIERNFELTKFSLKLPYIYEDIKFKSPFLFFKDHYPSLEFNNNKKNILLIPGASHDSKRYPIEKFIKLIELFDANYFVIWGNINEKILAKKIESASSKVTVSEELSLPELVSYVSKMDAIIGPDTGPTHIAWALNKPSITLYGPTPGYRNSYITKKNQVIESESLVNPYKIDKNDYSICSIDPHRISKVLQKILY